MTDGNDSKDGADGPEINEEVPVHFKADRETKERVKERLGHGAITEVCRGALREAAYGAEVGKREQLRARLQELRDERGDLTRERDDLDRQIAAAETKIDRVEAKLDAVEDRQGRYEGHLESIEATMEENPEIHVTEDFASVEKAAVAGDCTEGDVLDDLRERTGYPEERFEKPEPHDPGKGLYR